MEDSKELFERILAEGKASEPERYNPSLEPYIVKPESYAVQSLAHLRIEPLRVTQSLSVYDVGSFSEYFQTYRNLASRIFVDKRTPRLIGIIDYHDQPANQLLDTYPVARRTKHRVFLEFRNTVDWGTWMASNNKFMTQVEMAQFIEDMVDDIMTPNGQYMLDVARTLEAKKDVSFRSSTRLENGETQFEYNEEIKGTAQGGQLEIPTQFVIKLQPFENGPVYSRPVRFRYKLDGQNLRLKYQIVRPDKALDAALDDTITLLRNGREGDGKQAAILALPSEVPVTIGIPAGPGAAANAAL